MTRQRRSAPYQHSQSRQELVVFEKFDYTPLDANTAEQVQTAAHRIRQLMKQTVEDLIAVGKELLAVKAALPHGRFLPWLHGEFGWTDRTARRFMAVAERFGTKMDIISDLRIQPTAAYLLAAPSVPEEASAQAVCRAEKGERITAKVAKEILGSVRNKPEQHERGGSQATSSQRLLGGLLESLECLRRQWTGQLSELALHLKDFVDSLEENEPL